MFSLIRAQPTTLLRRAQNVRWSITTSSIRQNHNNVHTPDSYSKEVDYTPPNDEKIHRVDPESDRVQKPYEAPSGQWSRAGVKADEYRNKESKQDAPKGGESIRYGARKTLAENNEAETSKSDGGSKSSGAQTG